MRPMPERLLRAWVASPNELSFRCEFSSVVTFGEGKSTIKPMSFSVLDEVMGILRERPALRIAIEGHSDFVEASMRKFQGIDRQRAVAVRDYLIRHGLEALRLEVIALAAMRPIKADRSLNSRAKNRQGTFRALEELGTKQQSPASPQPSSFLGARFVSGVVIAFCRRSSIYSIWLLTN